MIEQDLEHFLSLTEKGNFVPVYQEWMADLETPVSAWYKVCAGQPYSFLLESVEGGEKLGRYSFLGCDPVWILEIKGEETTQIFRNGTQKKFTGNPFHILPQCIAQLQPVQLPELPPGIGGWFGFWGYEAIRWLEPKVPTYPTTEGDLPDGIWMQVDNIVVFDQVKRKIWAIAYADLLTSKDPRQAYTDAFERVNKLVLKLRSPLPAEAKPLTWRSSVNSEEQPQKYESNTTRDHFCTNVEKAKEYIRAGDIFQVALSQKLTFPYEGKPFDLYRSLRQINPSPYMAYYNFNGWQIVGSSPEVMVKAEREENGKIKATLRPIAGTRPRGKTPSEDESLERDLLQDRKERAEHVMLVDLGRNDLGRVCVKGSVRVDQLMVIERYSHVMHIVSNVVGELAPDKSVWDLLGACFPAGTVSGAPKIRAMEIIRELEPERRGPYSGAYGYYDFEGQLNSAISIRTAIIRPGKSGQHLVSVQVGAGIVADSQPEKEYEETINKASAVKIAIECLN